MAKGTRVCKICGKEYPYCSTMTVFDGNRWQDVACCIEHATEYFKQVAISRGELKNEEPKKEAPKKTAFKKQVEFKEKDEYPKEKGYKKSEDSIDAEWSE